MKCTVVCLLFTFSATFAFTQEKFDHSHKIWTEFLTKFVTDSAKTTVVDYKAIKADPTLLNSYLKSIENISKIEYRTYDKNQKMALLINAYNAYTIKLIIDNYPIKSIKDIGNVFSGPWDKKFINIIGEKISLGNIEHDKLRKDFKEPRIHFVIVCASIGCPALRRESYTDKKLEAQLADAEKIFLSDSNRNVYHKDTNTVELSSIFKWFEEDFSSHSGSLNNFIAEKVTTNKEVQNLIKNKKVKIKFQDYDWSLNQKSENN